MTRRQWRVFVAGLAWTAATGLLTLASVTADIALGLNTIFAQVVLPLGIACFAGIALLAFACVLPALWRLSP